MTGTLMAFLPVSARVGDVDNISVAPLISHTYGGVFLMFSSAAATGGLRRWDAWPNGNEIIAANLADCKAPANGFVVPWCMAFNHNAVAVADAAGNGITFLTQRNFTNIGTVPKNAGDPYFAPQQMCAISANGDDVMILTPISTVNAINAVSFSESKCRLLGTMTEPQGIIGSIPDGSGSQWFACGRPTLTTSAITLYKGDSGTFQTVGTFTPAQVDATWSHIDTLYGIIVDQTDNNPMLMVQNITDSVAQTYYLIKLNAATGAILWKAALPGSQNWDSHGMANALVKNQTIFYLTTTRQLCTINTANGTFVSEAFDAAVIDGAAGQQVSEDVVGSIYFKGTWTEGTTHPNYTGTTMGVNGVHAITNRIMRYFPHLPAPSPPPPAIMATSRQRAWTFTLDGHKFYVLDLGDQGTLLYDTTTSSWSEFVTTNYNNWNFRNGTMWDQRIVGGDTDMQQIWETAPSLMLDNGVTPITHITTGGLVKRNRVFTSCAALRLNVSIGQLDENGATVLLEFSDDQGKTWVEMDLLSLVEGDYDAELAWQGLGSFAAPGRVFRITDVGGFIRIDGCDAELDDFDEDNNSAARDEG